MTTHAMIDIETLDTKPSSVILTLGAVKFDPFSPGVEPHSALYIKPDVDEQTEAGRTISEGTLEFWGKQSEEIQAEAFSENDRITVEDFIGQLRKYCVGVDKFWAQGVTFDYTILENLIDQFQKSGPPWDYYRVRDSRTLFDLLSVDPRKEIQNSLHNALADSYYQAVSVQKAYKQLNIIKK